jgi:hypothetical protein
MLPFTSAALAAQRPADAPRVGRLDGSGLRGGEWRYAATVHLPDGVRRDFGSRIVSLATASYHGRSAWLLVEQQRSPMGDGADSVYLTHDDLVPMHRVLRLQTRSGALSMRVDFTRDSVLGSMRMPDSTEMRLATSFAAGAIASATILELALRSLPLDATWRGSFDLLNPAVKTMQRALVKVIGEERVTVPAGTFDTWVLIVVMDGPGQRLYIAKSGPLVKTQTTLPKAGGAMVETVLLR